VREDRRRQFGLVLLVLLLSGLAAIAVVSALRWELGRLGSTVAYRLIGLDNAPVVVQEAARQLKHSRVAYAVPVGSATYLIISAGDAGSGLELKAVRAGQPAGRLDVELGTRAKGERLILATIPTRPDDMAAVHFRLDGREGRLPALLNPDRVPLVGLPSEGGLVVQSLQPEATVTGGVVEVAGFARTGSGQISIQVFGDGVQVPLGELLRLKAATTAPNWGSFRAAVPVDVRHTVSHGVVLVYDPDSGTKAVIPVRFGHK